jgi:hypothetical protein
MYLAAATLLYFFSGAVVYGCLYLLHKRKNPDPSAREEGFFAEHLPENATFRERLEYGLIQFVAAFVCLLIWPFVLAYMVWHAWFGS